MRYVEECEWRQLFCYGDERARERGIDPKEVAGLVEQHWGQGRPTTAVSAVTDINVAVSSLALPVNKRMVPSLALRGQVPGVPVPVHPGRGFRGLDAPVRLGSGTCSTGDNLTLERRQTH